MDAGLQKAKEMEPIEKLMESLPTDLSPTQRLAVIDRLFELEAHWLAGGSLAATVFTSLYLLKSEAILSKDPTLWAYCEGVKASCSLVRSMIYKGGVAEEEDFNLHAFGLPIDEGAGGEIGALARANEALQALSLALKHSQEASSSSVEDKKVWTSITLRIRWRIEALSGLHELCDSSRPDIAVAASHFASALALLTNPEGGIQSDGTSEAAVQARADALGFEPGINSRLLAPIPPRTVKPMSWTECCSLVQSTLEHIAQALDLEGVATFEALQLRLRAYSQLKAGPLARSIAHYLLLPQSWGHVDHAASAITLDPEAPWPPSSPSPGADDNILLPSPPLPTFVPSKEMIAIACGLPRNSHRHLSSDVDIFLEQCSIAIGNWCQAMLMNPCRMRRRLRRGLEDWGHLYQHALGADHSPPLIEYVTKRGWKWQTRAPQGPGATPLTPRPLSSWVEKETCSCMLQHLFLGFDLDLYQTHELVMIYWYCDSLASNQRGAAMLLKEAIPSPSASDTHGKPTGPKLPTRGASGKKGSAKKQQPQAQATDSSPSSPLEPLEKEDQATWEARRAMADSEMIRLERTHWLCQGYMRLILAAKKMGLVKENPPPFNDAAQGFEQRFASFHTMLVCPDPLSYNDFESSVNVEGIEAAALLKLAAESFEFASKVLELEIRAASATEELQLKSYPDSKSLRAIARSALRNKVCCGVLCQAEEESTASSLHLTFDFSTTPLWPALGATRSK